jgi:DNA-binding response OmpR family regulator/DNA-binding CsgD family transcriptional regulator
MNLNAETPSPKVVLVVDDAPDSLRLLCDTLSIENYAVLIARDAAEAIERFELNVPDAVLLDAIMPGLSGFELCRHLKSVPRWSHVPVIFMTGLTDTGHIVKGFESGAVDYVVKPIKIAEVLARLSTHIFNARISRLAGVAVDVAGLGVVVLDSQSRMAWRSPKATEWLDAAFGDEAQTVSDRGEWLHSATLSGDAAIQLPDGTGLSARHLGRASLGEATILLSRQVDATTPNRLSQASLTPRESEVLSWLAKGKTNRDIADILDMSPRTVNKHLEHIFEKLGVETRTSAAALASGLLSAPIELQDPR